MVKKKNRDTIITVAIIGAIGAIIAGYYQGPLADTQWQERPKVSLSLGEKNSFPSDKLLEDKFGHYVPIFINNRGESDGKTVFVVSGINTKVRIGNIGEWEYEQFLPFTIISNSTTRAYPIYVIPDEGAKIISINFSTQQPEQIPPFQELDVFRPTFLTFEKDGKFFVLTDQR